MKKEGFYIICEHTHRKSGRIIQGWMFVDSLVRLQLPHVTYNHALVYIDGQVWEAVAEGVVNTSYDEHMSRFQFKKPYMQDWIQVSVDLGMKKKITEFMNKQVGKKYEFNNFFFHPLKTITGFWLGQKGNKKYYCIELCIDAVNFALKNKLNRYLNPTEFHNVMEYIFKGIRKPYMKRIFKRYKMNMNY